MKEIVTRWNEFCNYVIECVPNYTDNDFTFNNFMDWWDGQEEKEEII